MADAGRYRTVRSLGRGGMAEVFEAVAIGESGFERRVAIKRMLADLEDDPAFATMFLDEARTASALHHANLVAVLDYGIADGLPFQVLEFVDGRDAERLSRTGREMSIPMPIEVALHLCLEVAHALDYVHDAKDASGASLGVVHRDVSPSNVLVASNGDVKLTDFGIALARSRATETSAGVIRGKPAFMAPEQVVRGTIDGRTDVFGLGCTLHALLTGVSPLSRENAMVALLSGGQLELDANLPDDVRAVVAKAIRSVRHERHASAGDLAAQLSAALAARGHHNPRANVQRWLELIRSSVRTPAQSRGVLDAMVAVEFVLAPAADGVRQFVTATVGPKQDQHAPLQTLANPEPQRHEPDPLNGDRPTRPERAPVRAVPQPMLLEADVQRTPPVRTASAAMLALLGVGIGGGLGVIAWREARSSTPPAPVVTDRLTPMAAPPAPIIEATTPPPSREPGTAGEVSPARVIAPATTARPIPGAAAMIRRMHVEHPRPGLVTAAPEQTAAQNTPTTPPAAPAVQAERVVESSATGVVAIGGDGAQRAEIMIDGTRQGFAPRALTLPVGRHVLQLVRPDGERIGPQSIDVVEQNTQSSPLRVRFP